MHLSKWPSSTYKLDEEESKDVSVAQQAAKLYWPTILVRFAEAGKG